MTSPPSGVRRRALIVAHSFPPCAAIGTFRTLRLVRHLSAQGWEVVVLTSLPRCYLPGTPIDEALLKDIPEEIEVLRAGALSLTPLARLLRRGVGQAFRLADNGRAKALPHEWWGPVGLGGAQGADGTAAPARPQPRQSALGRLKRTIDQLCAIPDADAGWLLPAISRGLGIEKKRRPDVIYSTAPPWTGHLVARALASAWRLPWVADFRDPWARGPWRGDRLAIARRAAAFCERQTLRRANAVLFTTRATRDEVAQHYGWPLSRKLHVVANGCDPIEIASADRVAPDGCFTLAHVGSLYGGRNPLPLFRALAALLKRGAIDRGCFKLRLIGPIALPGVDLRATCRDLGLDEVIEFVPRMSRRDSLGAMVSASALLLVQPGHPLSIPAKAYEYLAAGKPILALTDEGATADLVRSCGVGLTAPAGDEEAIAAAILTLMQMEAASLEPPPAALFDGRLRAAETAAILEGVAQAAHPGRSRSRAGRALVPVAETREERHAWPR